MCGVQDVYLDCVNEGCHNSSLGRIWYNRIICDDAFRIFVLYGLWHLTVPWHSSLWLPCGEDRFDGYIAFRFTRCDACIQNMNISAEEKAAEMAAEKERRLRFLGTGVYFSVREFRKRSRRFGITLKALDPWDSDDEDSTDSSSDDDVE